MKRIGIAVLVWLMCAFTASAQDEPMPPANDSLLLVKKDTVTGPPTKADTLIAFAKTFLGTRYCYGSCSPKNGFDCSGFIYYVFKEHGMVLPRSSYEMGKFGKKVPLSEARKGDIILFRGTNAQNPRIGHAALVISEQGKPLQFIHSSSNTKRGGVILSGFDDSNYYEKRFVKVIRVL
jgi:murein DD-endopeptidase / murein LD-carboxypeptidase